MQQPDFDPLFGVSPALIDRLGDPAKKKAFAYYLRRYPDNAQGYMNAAGQVFPDEADHFLRWEVSAKWPFDPVVRMELDKLARAEPEADLPTVEQVAREVYSLSIDNTKSVKERLDAYRLYGELRQMIGKAGPTINNQTNNTFNDNRGFYVVPERATDTAAFEREAIEQQARLVSNARKPITAA